LRNELTDTVRSGIGPIATPSEFYFVAKLPKTRSGKIMRRLLKSIAKKEKIGDVSTLEDGAAVEEVQSAFDELQSTINRDSQEWFACHMDMIKLEVREDVKNVKNYFTSLRLVNYA